MRLGYIKGLGVDRGNQGGDLWSDVRACVLG